MVLGRSRNASRSQLVPAPPDQSGRHTDTVPYRNFAEHHRSLGASRFRSHWEESQGALENGAVLAMREKKKSGISGQFFGTSSSRRRGAGNWTPSFGAILETMSLLVAVSIALVSPASLAKSTTGLSHCDRARAEVQGTPDASLERLFYGYRGDRCEGFYENKLGKYDAIEIRGVFTARNEFTAEAKGKIQLMPYASADGALMIRAISAAFDVYYQMDTIVDGCKTFTWKTDILAEAAKYDKRLATKTIAFSAWYVGAKRIDERIYVPLSINPTDTGLGNNIQLVIWPIQRIKSLEASIWRQDDNKQIVKSRVLLGPRGYWPQARARTVYLRKGHADWPIQPGRYRVELRAVLPTSANKTSIFFFEWPEARVE